MKTIVVLSDSLNRHFLPPYGNEWVVAPNIARLADRSILFDNHWLGSAPCMPARRDIITGRINFLEREWGGLEPFDRPLVSEIRRAGVHCHIETDHHHYAHVGGENYHCTFSTWRLHRGQENDRCWSRDREPEEPDHLGRWTPQYATNRSTFLDESQFPTPATFAGAIDWLDANRDRDDFMLWVEVFDPHEPFDYADAYAGLYEENWTGPLYNWSGYEHAPEGEEASAHLRREYARTLTMMDAWLGRLLDKLDALGILDETLIILTTDHGHMLGEHGVTGKNRWHVWNEMARLPLIVLLPGSRHAGERRSQLTQNIDLMPTLMDYHGVPIPNRLHGHSLRPALEDDAPGLRAAALYGWFGQSVNVTDGTCTYLRSPADASNRPLYRHFLTPGSMHLHDMCGPEFYDQAELGRFLPYTDWPVLRARATRPVGDDWATSGLYRIDADPYQTMNLCGTELEEQYERLLARALAMHDAPPSQYERLGLPNTCG